MTKLPETDHIAFLIDRKFPEYARLKQEAIKRAKHRDIKQSSNLRDCGEILGDRDRIDGDNEIRADEETRSTLFNDVREYRVSLEKRSKNDLLDLYREELEKKNIEDDQDRFFNKPSAEADFEYWSKMADWTLDEAVALSFGKSPGVVNEKSLAKTFSWTSPFVHEYKKTMELARRAVKWKKLYDPVVPAIFVKWAQEYDIDMPEELVEKVQARGPAIVNWENLYKELAETINVEREETFQMIAAKNKRIEDLLAETITLRNQLQQGLAKPLHTKERESLLKMVIGMAVGGYAYDPAKNRSAIPKEISDDLIANGIQLDEDTVRKWLRKSAELLPQSPDDEAD